MTTESRWVIDRLTVLSMQIGQKMPTFVAADLDGVNWADAPRPRRRHKCTPQTRGLGPNSMVERCACGAIRTLWGGALWPRLDHRWYGRNSRGKA